jgi:hypothetical protein
MKTFYKMSEAIQWAKNKLLNYGYVVQTEKWQGIPSPDDMFETMNTSFQAFVPHTLDKLREEIRPNLPWADDHFEERIDGHPLNPPPSNEWWPFNQKKNEMFKKEKKFSHTYPERLWPKYTSDDPNSVMRGIRYEYGDFGDVIDLLQREPYTRQAFLPMWFPEDTGSVHGERVPCTIGYHFMRRGDYLHMVYYIRSCDYLRHFRDDIYMACRKILWVLDTLKKRDPEIWGRVTPGYYAMHITSLHCFNKEKGVLKLKKS